MNEDRLINDIQDQSDIISQSGNKIINQNNENQQNIDIITGSQMYEDNPYAVAELEGVTVDAGLIDEIIEEVRPNANDSELLKSILNVSVATFVGIGLQMELHEARAKYGLRAVRAAAEEIAQILKREVWRGITMEEMENYPKPIPSSMKVKEKFKGSLLDRLKARLTCGGHRQ